MEIYQIGGMRMIGIPMISNLQNLKFNALQMDTKRSELKKLSDQRTKLIQDCLEDGLSVIKISEATNISRQRVYRILNKGE